MRIVIRVLIGILVLTVIGLVVFYRAARHVPKFYQEALAIEPAVQEKASEQMVKAATKLQNNLYHDGGWRAVFTAEQINGWLAVDLQRNFAASLPREFHDPRVSITPEGITLACRAESKGFSSVVSLEVTAYLESPNVIALRVRKARAGAIPWPLDQVLKAISEAARRSELRLEWRQAEGDPVALITLPPIPGKHGREVRIQTLKLEKDSIHVDGTTLRTKPPKK